MVKGVTALCVATLLPAVSAQAQTIVVGGSDGWVVRPGNAEYEDIVANVGDIIQFTYSSWYHDVMLVDNENCDLTNGQMVDETGDFAWTVPEPGTYIFACARGDHCSSGNQQVTVRVAGGGGGDGTGGGGGGGQGGGGQVGGGMEAPTGSTIVVGGSDGWVVRPGNAEYEDIVANVGDIIQFTYSSWYHDVMLVDNENCDLTNGQMVDETGDFAWTVPEPGTYIFACARGDHCSSGNQQVTVRVAGGGGGDGTGGGGGGGQGGGGQGDGGGNVECVGDVTGDMIVDVNDLLSLLGVFGQTGEMMSDITNDLVVDVNDLLMLLGEFGRTC